NCFSSAAEVGEAHLGVLAREKHAWSASMEHRQNRFLNALRRTPAVTGLGGDIDINAWPDESVRAGNSLKRAFCFAEDVVRRKACVRNLIVARSLKFITA